MGPRQRKGERGNWAPRRLAHRRRAPIGAESSRQPGNKVATRNFGRWGTPKHEAVGRSGLGVNARKLSETAASRLVWPRSGTYPDRREGGVIVPRRGVRNHPEGVERSYRLTDTPR